jgi:two-component system response regulator AtoC
MDSDGDSSNKLLAATRSAASFASTADTERAYLLVLEGGSSRMFHLPRHGVVLIGRTTEAELQLQDESVSRRHARILIADGEASVSDLESYNGTRVNGEPVEGARELASGDVISIGDVLLVLHRTAREVAPRTLLPAHAARRRVAEEIERVQTTGRTFTLATLRFSEPALDRAAVERIVQTRLRLIDAASWLSERELLLIVPEHGPAQVRRLAGDLIAALHTTDAGARIGLASYLADGCDAETLLSAGRSAASAAKTGGILAAADAATRLTMGDREILLADPAMLGLFELLKRLARSDIQVLIRGETGAGKEAAAYAVHHFSARSDKPFVAVNCAAIAETLIESELFGHERGAFSGATHSKPGLLEAASGGTVFLDELGELSASAQSKLLRALETKRITRVGDVREREVDIRIVAATHRDLEADIRSKRFREDLFFRLGAATVILPPLRERPREVTLLGQTFLRSACSRIGRSPLTLSPTALRALATYRWPGNVRELRNTMEYVAAAIVDPVVEVHHLPAQIASVLSPPLPLPGEAPAPDGAPAEPVPVKRQPERRFRPIAEELKELERRRMDEALIVSNGVRKVAAELISMPLRTFTLKLKQYGLGSGDHESGGDAAADPEGKTTD